MGYPVDSSFTRRHIAAVCRRHWFVFVICCLLMALLGAWVSFVYMPLLYRVSGGVLVKELAAESAASKLQTAFRGALQSNQQYIYRFADCGLEPHIVDGTAVADWWVDFPNLQSAEAFLHGMPEFMQNFKSGLPEAYTSFSAEKKLNCYRSLKYSVLNSAAGAFFGILLGLLIAVFIALFRQFHKRSVGNLQRFSKQHGLPVLGVLPDLAENVYFDEAIQSLLLKIQFCKPPASQAFVLMVSDFIAGSGAGTVSLRLSEALKSAGCRVLFLNKNNIDMSMAQGLSQRMESLLALESGNYDFIIINVPEIRSSSVPLIIGKLADTALLVCNYRCCPSYPLQVALWRLNKAKVNVAGCVINRFPLQKKQAEYNLYRINFRSYKA